MSTTLYLYWVKNKSILTNIDKGINPSPIWPLVGLDRGVWRGTRMKSIEKSLGLKPFEIQQSRFEDIIHLSKNLDIWIKYIEFSSKLSDEELEELEYHLKNKNNKALLAFIDEQRYEMRRDIYEVTFSYGATYRQFYNKTAILTREAVLTVDCSVNEINNIISTKPIGILAGTIACYDSGEEIYG